MIEAKAEPFCSRLTRLATGVLGLKKATQLVLILVAALDDPPPEEPPPAGEADGRADDGVTDVAAALAGLLLADGRDPDDEPLPLPQAATVTASAANAAVENTLAGGNRIGALPVAHAPNSRTITQVADVDYAEQRPSVPNINA